MTLYVSSGPANATVPSLIGLSSVTAGGAVHRQAGLGRGEHHTRSRRTNPAGTVIVQNPGAGATVAPDTAVNLAVSTRDRRRPPRPPRVDDHHDRPVVAPDLVQYRQQSEQAPLTARDDPDTKGGGSDGLASVRARLSRPGLGGGQEVGEERGPTGGEQRFGVELDPLDRQGAVAQAHDHAVRVRGT